MGPTAIDGPSAPKGYTLLRPLGENRPRRTLLCTNEAGQEVVVRVLADPGEASAEHLLDELRALAAAGDHPCAVPITRVWADPGVGVCVEQPHLSPGTDAPMAPAAVVVGALRLAAALTHLHARGILHRDVRPGNVLRDAGGEWMLANAGVAHAVHRVRGRGEPPDPAYAARELRGWQAPSAAADVYGLGATAHAALRGWPPGRENSAATATTDVPPELAALVPRMLAEDPAERPTLAELDQILRPLVPRADAARIPPHPPARPAPPPPRPKVTGLSQPPPTPASRRRGLLVGAVIGAVFLAGAAVVVAGQDSDDVEQVASAEVVAGAPSAAPSASAEPGPSAPATASTPTASPGPTTKGGEPTPKRGTDRSARGSAVDEGLAPYKVSVFIYRGRLAALLRMRKVSPDLKELRLYSAQPDGSNRLPGDDTFAELSPEPPGERLIMFFFDAKVSTRRCVEVEPVRRKGKQFTDPRTVCVQPPSAYERAKADEGWPTYLKGERGAATSKKPPAKSRSRNI